MPRFNPIKGLILFPSKDEKETDLVKKLLEENNFRFTVYHEYFNVGKGEYPVLVNNGRIYQGINEIVRRVNNPATM